MPSVDDLKPRLRAVLERELDVLVAYLFGSVARGTSGPMSDVDVAVLLRKDGDLFKRRLQLIAEVSTVVGSERADVVVLNEAPVALAFRVLRDGQILVSRDERARIRHRVSTLDRYMDMAPFRKVQSEGLHHRLQEGRFGRP
jgi:hypothetical protein